MATGDEVFRFFPEQNKPPLANPATPDERLTATSRHTVLDFDATTTEYAYFSDIIPENYSGGDIDFTAMVMMSSATSGNVRMDLEFENDSGQDLDSDSFATASVADDVAVSGTSGVLFSITGTLAASDLDGLAAGDPFRLKLSMPQATTSNASGDREFFGIYGVEAGSS